MITDVRMSCMCGRSWEHACNRWPAMQPGTIPPPLSDQIAALPERLKQFRARYGLSLRTVAHDSGISDVTVLNIERGKGCTMRSLIAVAAYLQEHDV